MCLFKLRRDSIMKFRFHKFISYKKSLGGNVGISHITGQRKAFTENAR